MKTILFYINQIYDGGAERVIVNLANYFSKQGYRTVLVTSFRHENEYKLNDSVIRLSTDEYIGRMGSKRRFIKRILCLRRFCKDYKPNTVVSFMLEPNVRALLATLSLPIRTIISVRNNPSLERKGLKRRMITGLLYPLADGCVFQTDKAREYYPEKLREKSEVIFNPVNEEFYNSCRMPVRGRIVSCGRLNKIKNYEMLIRAFAIVHEQIPWSSLLIYGEGDEEENLGKLIDELNLDDSAKLMGKTLNVSKILETADVYAMSSDSEGMPNALMEAMAAAVPVISTDCPPGAPAMLIENYKNGMLVDVGDTEAMASSIIYLLQHTDKAATMGIEASIRAEKYKAGNIYPLWEKYCFNE